MSCADDLLKLKFALDGAELERDDAIRTAHDNAREVGKLMREVEALNYRIAELEDELSKYRTTIRMPTP